MRLPSASLLYLRSTSFLSTKPTKVSQVRRLIISSWQRRTTAAHLHKPSPLRSCTCRHTHLHAQLHIKNYQTSISSTSPRIAIASLHTSPISHWGSRNLPENPIPLDLGNAAMTVKDRYNAPYEEQDVNEVNELVKTLTLGSQKGKNSKGFSCRKSDYDVDNSKLSVRSWKFQDWDYKKRDLPTNARGLFTLRNSSGNHEIVTRGYDKFFNIGEVHRTEWSWIGEHTKGPYEVTMKENGCIIFISGLPDGTLLVCSKHSTGTRGDATKSHSAVGDQWIDKQLARVGKTRGQLAKFLRDANATAVAELCDDSFEEHILAYTGDDAGLYLHGINLNLPTFSTWSGPQVQAFADDWGFRKIEVFDKQTVAELKTFLEGVAETGEWNGRAVEGFVIRCKARYGASDTKWHDWFFKYKFEEPYLMYRQWREVTKAMLSGKQPKIRKHKTITEQYLQYARDQVRKNPSLGPAFQQNHGIIAMRDGFLASIGRSGAEIIKSEEDSGESKAKSVVLVPIATIGCGKTTVALGLVKLFDFGHVQNDNITVKRGKPFAFAQAVCQGLNLHAVCIADRNNHQKREREQLFKDVKALNPEVDFVALHYVHYKPGEEDLISRIKAANQQRIFDRGDNHQTIHSGTGDQEAIVGIMDGFIQRFQPIDTDTEPDSEFDLVIDLDPLVDSRENLETVVSKLYENYPHLLGEDMPSSHNLDEAIQAALSDYTVDIKHVIGSGGSSSNKNAAGPSRDKGKAVASGREKGTGKASKQPLVEYFAVRVPTANVNVALDQAFATQSAEGKKFYTQLKNSRRIQGSFHITMVHRANVNKQAELWKHYDQLLQNLQPGKDMLDELDVKLEKVVWNDRIMAIVASLVDDKGHECGNDYMHITVGTADTTIKPKESNDLLKVWAANEEDLGAAGINELPLGKNGQGVIVHGILSAVMGANTHRGGGRR
ncbi:hypothetical protein TWF694_001078 [Orbilia ellipsospora]|uniref:RNA ligase (ATP) n=1 Tax=Orbilia ellipsospora TaxID=2528407 RepID=A0AAV9XQU5_9PEZI